MKEQDLLKAASTNDWAKMLRIFAGERRSRMSKIGKGSSKKSVVESKPQYTVDEDGAIITKKVDVKLECRDATGSTPLLVAALGGHVDAVECLLAHGANVAAKDSQGHTPLHMAVWQERNSTELLELLLRNHADPSEQNTKGESPIHFAARSGQVFVVMLLLDAGGDCQLKTSDGDSALDVAARHDRREVVSLLLHHDPSITKYTRSLREAARAGRVQVVRLLLDAAMDVTAQDADTLDSALHEAVRFTRIEVCEELLKYGADPYCQNAQGDTPVSLLEALPANRAREQIAKLIQEYKEKEVRLPALVLDQRRQRRAQEADTHDDATVQDIKAGKRKLPQLRVRDRWTEDLARFRSGATPGCPPTNLLSDDPGLVWEAPCDRGSQWVIFDFKRMYSLTCIQLIGRFSPHLPRNCQLAASDTPDGPWRVIKSCNVEPSEETVHTFDGFFATAQYFRLQVLRNHGAETTRLSGVRFFGVDATLLKWFSELGCTQYYDKFVDAGFNQRGDLPLLKKSDIAAVVQLPGHQKKIEFAIKKLKGESKLFDRLVLSQPAARKCHCDQVLPPIHVQANPGVSEEVQLVVHGGATVCGSTVKRLEVDGPNPSLACFDDIALSPPGRYLIEICGVQSPDVLVRASKPTLVVEARRSKSAMDVLFSDLRPVLDF
eukprot:m.51964 g.51964  ORF g.51964 m.51964 type:complete len:663 (+) comp12259_c0_seq1:485-2473(+)